MRKPAMTIQQIDHDLRSEQQSVRAKAVQELLAKTQSDPAIHATALGLIRRSLDAEKDPWSAATAARGVEQIVGPVEARKTWLRLLDAQDGVMVAGLVLNIEDRFYVPKLIELLHSRPEPVVKVCAIHTLGRLGDPAAFPILINCLPDPALRCPAIEALSALGDPRAIAHLQPLLNDMTERPEPDERGAVLHVCDLAAFAIRRLQKV